MAIKLKTSAEIEKMRKAGRIVYAILSELEKLIRPGVSTAQLNRFAEKLIAEYGAKPLFKGVPNPRAGYPFPACICTSIDCEVVHGIPSDDVILQEGQIISIDCGVRYEGYCGDAARTYGVGKISDEKRKLIEVTKRTLEIATENMAPNVKWSKVAAKMQAYVEKNGFSVVTEFVGHGIGKEMHEDPKVPNYVSPELLRNDIILKPGMVIAVEPMVNMGVSTTTYAKDGWTVLTADRKPSAHFEHTIAITANGVDILTDGKEIR